MLCGSVCVEASENQMYDSAVQTLREGIMKEAMWAMEQQPLTITAAVCERSAGDKHDFYSEGDYWWTNPADPDGAYIRRDGETNPQNFVAHRQAMTRLNRIMGALASAYVVTGEEKYVEAAMKHAKAWFIDTTTMMNPSLLYAQAIKGVTKGRGIGIIDTIHLMEVVQAMLKMQDSAAADKVVVEGTRKWFGDYLTWLSTHPQAIDEMNAKNNHGTCWVMQAAAFARFTGNKKMMQFCADRYRDVLLPMQIAADGSFPLEMARTKPYGYALFNLEAMATTCQILSATEGDLWDYKSGDKPSLKKGVEFMAPYLADKGTWPLKPDVMYWECWPVAQPSMLFAAVRFGNKDWFELWSRYDHYPTIEEVIRNVPVRNPLIWL